jgi:hypothetical protein
MYPGDVDDAQTVRHERGVAAIVVGGPGGRLAVLAPDQRSRPGVEAGEDVRNAQRVDLPAGHRRRGSWPGEVGVHPGLERDGVRLRPPDFLAALQVEAAHDLGPFLQILLRILLRNETLPGEDVDIAAGYHRGGHPRRLTLSIPPEAPWATSRGR